MNGIAFCGKMTSGKSTLAKALCSYYKDYHKQMIHPVIYSFATGVKKCAVEYFNMENKDRDLLVNIGMGMRKIDKNVWVNYLHNNMQKDAKLCERYKLRHIPIVDDLRFTNEYEYLKKNDFVIIKLNISDEEQKNRLKKIYPKDWKIHTKYLSHESEQFNNGHDLELDTLESIEDNIKIIKHYLQVYNTTARKCAGKYI